MPSCTTCGQKRAAPPAQTGAKKAQAYLPALDALREVECLLHHHPRVRMPAAEQHAQHIHFLQSGGRVGWMAMGGCTRRQVFCRQGQQAWHGMSA